MLTAELEFSSTFEIKALNETESTEIRAFGTWFDTFFSADSGRAGQAKESDPVDLTRFDADLVEREIESGSHDKTDVSFTTGPQGQNTHWKQVIFLLKQGFTLHPGKLSSAISRIHSAARASFS